MDQSLRNAVLDRDRYCWKCGGELGVAPAVHHRQLRSQGGRDDLTNLIGLHHTCHNVQQGSVHQNPAWSVERGYLVPSWADPATAPILAPSGQWVVLTVDGKTRPIGDKDE